MLPGTPFKLHSDGDVHVIEFTARSLDQSSYLTNLSKHLDDLVDRRNVRLIILDFANVQFLASSALGIIVSLQQKLDYHKGKLTMCGLRKELRQVFKFSQLDRLLTFHETRDEAVAAVNNAENN